MPSRKSSIILPVFENSMTSCLSQAGERLGFERPQRSARRGEGLSVVCQQSLLYSGHHEAVSNGKLTISPPPYCVIPGDATHTVEYFSSWISVVQRAWLYVASRHNHRAF